ncbi:MAG: PHP-associated domain-containing protein, partial [Tepidisphaeraceae bacterium]
MVARAAKPRTAGSDAHRPPGVG